MLSCLLISLKERIQNKSSLSLSLFWDIRVFTYTQWQKGAGFIHFLHFFVLFLTIIGKGVFFTLFKSRLTKERGVCVWPLIAAIKSVGSMSSEYLRRNMRCTAGIRSSPASIMRLFISSKLEHAIICFVFGCVKLNVNLTGWFLNCIGKEANIACLYSLGLFLFFINVDKRETVFTTPMNKSLVSPAHNICM